MNEEKKENSNSETNYEYFEDDVDNKKTNVFKLNAEDLISSIPDYDEVTVKIKKKRNVFARIMFAIIIISVSIGLSLIILFALQDVLGVRKADMPITVDISENTGVSKIADMLEDKGIINSAFVFKAYFKLSKIEGNLNYGTYELNSNMSYEMIINELKKYSRSKDEVKVTFPEGTTIYEMANILQKNDVCKASEFIDAFKVKEFGFGFEKDISSNPLKFHKYEGYVFPETYNFYKRDNPMSVAKKMLSEFEKRVTPEMKEQMNKMGYNLEETLTIASIVQKEAGKTDEMKKVASVYFNRLKNKDVYPNLQACPTRDYANQLKKQMAVINQDVIDAYNTYEDAGLPPGPICNPGEDAIKATLNPETTEYFYFCTNLKTGQFYYAKTLKEHERNVRKAGLV